MDGCPFRFAFKSGFNSPAKVLAALENNISSAAQLFNSGYYMI